VGSAKFLVELYLGYALIVSANVVFIVLFSHKAQVLAILFSKNIQNQTQQIRPLHWNAVLVLNLFWVLLRGERVARSPLEQVAVVVRLGRNCVFVRTL